MKYKSIRHFNISGQAHELTFSCFHKTPYLNSSPMCEVFIDSLKRVREKYNLKIIAYVLMPEHVHLLLLPCNDKYSMSSILSSIKLPVAMKYSSSRKSVDVDYAGHFWQRGGGYDRNIFTKQAMKLSIEYIHFNPVRRKLADSPEKWYWLSAGYYSGFADYPIKMDEEALGVLL